MIAVWSGDGSDRFYTLHILDPATAPAFDLDSGHYRCVKLTLLRSVPLGDLYVVKARTGEGGPGGISTLVVEGDTPDLSLGSNERKMGWNAQPCKC